MDAEKLFLDNLETIERLARYVCRRHNLRDDDAAEFAAEVRLRLIDNDYAVIRKFEGRSSFSTWLTIVIRRIFYQRLVEERGKWRASAEAQRLGPKAVTLEQLTTRDGYSFDEAAEILTARTGAGFTIRELEAMYLRLPPRQPRPLFVSDEASADAVAARGQADEPLMQREREAVGRVTVAALDRILSGMPAEDRLLLQMRFWDCRKVSDIARCLNIDQKKLYKRLDRLFATLRTALAKAGVRHEDVNELLSAGHEIELPRSSGNRPIGPSHDPRGNVGGRRRSRRNH
ncbi:MAG TPA: sigma-70 family RNA polymerase sigma factor [Thermoanaerobaculia bacterium]|jgi:RNA polymerase sigma factor (sigma-70 family)